MRQAALDAAKKLYPRCEGIRDRMYCDKDGNVTVGIGCLIGKVEAKGLNFWDPDAGQPAKGDVIGTDWDDVHNKKRTMGRLILNNTGDIQALLDKRIAQMDNAAQIFPGYNDFPADAQLAINSYFFATGHLALEMPDPKNPAKKIPAEPNLYNAIIANDWWRASAEVHMGDESRGNTGLRPRNDANRRLFANAARVNGWENDAILRLNRDKLYLNQNPKWPKPEPQWHWDVEIPTTGTGGNKCYLMGPGGRWGRWDWDSDLGEESGGPGDWYLDAIALLYHITGAFGGGCNGKCNDAKRLKMPHTGKTYFIIDYDKYVAYDWSTGQLNPSSPQSISDFGLPFSTLDTVVRGRGDRYQNKLYFFSGDQYIRWDLDLDCMDLGGRPQPLSTWGVLPAGWENGIHAAVNGEGKNYLNRLYIFKGHYYVAYDWYGDPNNWVPLPGYLDANKQPTRTIAWGWSGDPTNFELVKNFTSITDDNRIIGAFNAGITC